MFEIYLSEEGPRIIDNPQRIAVLHSVVKGNNTFSKMLKDTGLSKSSAYTVLKKLVAEGYLESYNDGSDVCYHPTVVPMLLSVDVDPDDNAGPTKLDTDNDFTDYMERWMLGYLIYSTHRSGISMYPKLSSMGYYIGMGMAEKCKGMSAEDGLEELSKYFRTVRFANVSVSGTEEVTVELMFDSSEGSQETFSVLAAAAVAGYRSTFVGKYIVARPVGRVDGSRRAMNFKLDELPMPKDTKIIARLDVENFSSDFTLFWNGRRYIPVVGESYNTIVEKLHLRPSSSQTLAEEMNLPQSTVSGYLRELEEDGVIKSRKYQKRVDYYLYAVKVYDWKNFDLSKEEGCRHSILRSLDDPDHAMRYWFHYFLCNISLLGLDVEILVHYIGKRFAMQIMEDGRGMSLEEILGKMTSQSGNIFSGQFAITSYSPLGVSRLVDYDMDDYISQQYQTLMNSILVTLMNEITGIPFRVKSSAVYGDGNRGYRAVIVPDPNIY